MRKRPLGKTGMSVTELGLGTWGLSGDGYGAVREADQERVILRAIAMGIRLIETADSYGHGAMEELLGRLLKNHAEVRVATKVGTDLDSPVAQKRFDASYLKAAVEESQKRLDRETLDLVMLHNPTAETVEKGEATDALKELQQDGALSTWGVSAGSSEVAQRAIGVGAPVISLTYNAFMPNDFREIAEDIERDEVGVLAHSILAFGLLAGQWPPDKVFDVEDHRSERWSSDELQKRISQLSALRPAVGGDLLSLRAVALRYALQQSLVSSVILGPRRVQQLDQLVREAGKGPPYMSEDILTALDARLQEVGIGV